MELLSPQLTHSFCHSAHILFLFLVSCIFSFFFFLQDFVLFINETLVQVVKSWSGSALTSFSFTIWQQHASALSAFCMCKHACAYTQIRVRTVSLHVSPCLNIKFHSACSLNILQSTSRADIFISEAVKRETGCTGGYWELNCLTWQRYCGPQDKASWPSG